MKLAKIPNRKLREIFSEGFRLYIASFPAVSLFSFLCATIVSLPALYLLIIPGQPEASTGESLLVSLGSLLVLVLSVYFVGSMLHMIHDKMKAKKNAYRETLSFVGKKMTIILASLFLFGVIGGLLYAFLFLSLGGVAAQWGIIIAYLLFVFQVPIILFEGAGPMHALFRSAQLMWRPKSFLRTALILFVASIPMVLLNLLNEIFLEKQLPYASLAIDTIVTTVFLPFVQSFFLVQYVDLKDRLAFFG